jgi:hypothetical protein
MNNKGSIFLYTLVLISLISMMLALMISSRTSHMLVVPQYGDDYAVNVRLYNMLQTAFEDAKIEIIKESTPTYNPFEGDGINPGLPVSIRWAWGWGADFILGTDQVHNTGQTYCKSFPPSYVPSPDYTGTYYVQIMQIGRLPGPGVPVYGELTDSSLWSNSIHSPTGNIFVIRALARYTDTEYGLMPSEMSGRVYGTLVIDTDRTTANKQVFLQNYMWYR